MIWMVCCRQTNRRHCHQQISGTGNEHTQTYLHGSLWLLAFLCQPTEEGNANRCEHHNETGIELLEDWCREGNLCVKVHIVVTQYQKTCHQNQSVDCLCLGCYALENAEKSINEEYAGNKIGDIKCHRLHT